MMTRVEDEELLVVCSSQVVELEEVEELSSEEPPEPPEPPEPLEQSAPPTSLPIKVSMGQALFPEGGVMDGGVSGL